MCVCVCISERKGDYDQVGVFKKCFFIFLCKALCVACLHDKCFIN